MPRQRSVQPRVASYFDSPSSSRLGGTADDEHDHYRREHEPRHEHHHAAPMPPPAAVHHHAPASAAAHTGSATGVSKKAMRREIAKYRKDLKDAYADSDKILHDRDLGWPGASTLHHIQRLKERATEKRRESDMKWMSEHQRQTREMAEYIKERKDNSASTMANPHPGIHVERITHLHTQTIHVADQSIADIAKEIRELVAKYNVVDNMTNDPPKHVHGLPNQYYIFSILRYMAREKYRYVQAIENWLRHMSSHDRDAKQKEYMALFTLITKLKEDMASERTSLTAMYKGKPRKPRPPMPALPDDNNPPKQVTKLRGG